MVAANLTTAKIKLFWKQIYPAHADLFTWKFVLMELGSYGENICYNGHSSSSKADVRDI
jgi:hypothetical protein